MRHLKLSLVLFSALALCATSLSAMTVDEVIQKHIEAKGEADQSTEIVIPSGFKRVGAKFGHRRPGPKLQQA